MREQREKETKKERQHKKRQSNKHEERKMQQMNGTERQIESLRYILSDIFDMVTQAFLI